MQMLNHNFSVFFEEDLLKDIENVNQFTDRNKILEIKQKMNYLNVHQSNITNQTKKILEKARLKQIIW